MLTPKQIKALAKVGKLRLRAYNGIPIAVAGTPDYEIKFPYEKFKILMGLDDIRLDWLLGKNNMIAGGSVLNWIWGENKNEDIDFFFKNQESAEIFTQFIKGIGFKHTMSTGYASTYFEPEQSVILQVVGNADISNPTNFLAYGEPELVIENFDFHLCRFAIDSEYLYTTSRAIQDLLKLTIDVTGNEKNYVQQRMFKYIRKGFFLSPRTRGAIIYESNRIKRDARKRYGSGW